MLPALLLLTCLIFPTNASVGDRSLVFVRCLNDCRQSNCSLSADQYASTQPLHMRLLDWTCPDECKYMCMWKTVDAFEKDELPVPQFYGKWPFVRLLGIQEPASALCSILNGLTYVVMLQYFATHIDSKAPMYYVWLIYAVVAMNAWTWSTVFHTRDTNMTEMMDYFCATLLILYSVFALLVRLSYDLYSWLGCVGGVGLLMFYIYHIHYLAFIRFNYGYNMLVNVCVGVCHTFGWVGWSWRTYRQSGRRYVWRSGVCALGLSMLSLLELGDFPPLYWALDAHALWHASTIPVAFVWFRFVVDDCRYLRSQLQKSGKLNGGLTSANNSEPLSSVTIGESKKTT